MKYFLFLITLICFAFTLTSQTHAQSVYYDSAIDHILKSEKSIDGKEVILSNLIKEKQNSKALANLYYRRGNMRITYTHLPKGIEDLQACLSIIEKNPALYSKAIEETQTKLRRAKLTLVTTQRLASDPNENLVTRFTALWKLGKRDKAVAIVKAEAIPEEFSTLSTNRMVKTGYLCEGSGPQGPQRSFRTRKAGPFWWCDDVKEKL